MKIVVLDAGTLDFESEAWSGFQQLGEVELYDTTESDPQLIRERIAEARVVFTNKVILSAEIIRQSPALKFIGVLATGYNAIDVEAARECGVTVCNVPTYGTATTAQHAVALMLELTNQVGLNNASVHAGDWQSSRHFSYWKQAPIELAGLTVGIVGFGTIGRRVGAVLNALGARIMASARTPRDTPDYEGFEWADSDAIFREADIVTLHCPETEQTRDFVNAALLKTMKPGALLVNTARGGLIVESDLKDALERGPLAGAALDVLRTEPMAEDCPLLGVSNCLITPHLAWASEAARQRLLLISVNNLQQFLAGTPVNVVS